MSQGYNQSFNPQQQRQGPDARQSMSIKSGSLPVNEPDRLRQEFAQIDTNGDGMVDRDEMDNFLARQGIDDEHRN